MVTTSSWERWFLQHSQHGTCCDGSTNVSWTNIKTGHLCFPTGSSSTFFVSFWEFRADWIKATDYTLAVWMQTACIIGGNLGQICFPSMDERVRSG